jgi:hypothetical protein
VLFLFRRIFVGKIFNIVSIVSITVVAAWTLSFFFANTFECGVNPRFYWSTPKLLAAHCGQYKYIMLGHTVSDVITDLMVLAIPLPIIWKLDHLHAGIPVSVASLGPADRTDMLQVRRQRQLLGPSTWRQISLVSSSPCHTLLPLTDAAIQRLRLVHETFEVCKSSSSPMIRLTSFAANVTNYMVWSYVEAGVGVVAASLPTLRPLVDARMPESIVNSVRSKLSLNSNRSVKRLGSDSEHLASQTDDIHLTSVDIHGNSSKNNTTNAEYVMDQQSHVPADSIQVHNQFTVKEARV